MFVCLDPKAASRCTGAAETTGTSALLTPHMNLCSNLGQSDSLGTNLWNWYKNKLQRNFFKNGHSFIYLFIFVRLHLKSKAESQVSVYFP